MKKSYLLFGALPICNSTINFETFRSELLRYCNGYTCQDKEMNNGKLKVVSTYSFIETSKCLKPANAETISAVKETEKRNDFFWKQGK